MATTGYQKWLKYFSKHDVETSISSKSDNIQLYFEREGVFLGPNRTDKYLNINERRIYARIRKTITYNSIYEVIYNGQPYFVSGSMVDKPKQEKGATENLRIKSTDFIELGDKKTIQFHNQTIEVRSFDSIENFSQSIQNGLSRNERIGFELKNGIKDILNKESVIWDAGIDPFEIAETGKYIGELLVAWKQLKQPEIAKIHIPISPYFRGVDSIVEMKTGDMYGISNKYGKGAKACLFGNILSSDCVPINSGSFLSYLKKFHFSIAKDTIYFWAFDRFNLPVFDPQKYRKMILYDSKLDPEHHKFIDTIRSNCSNQRILANLPRSSSAFLVRLISEELNNDKKSIEESKTVLSKKNFIQANLNPNQWNNGILGVDYKHSSDLEIKFYGTKSSISDISSRQGLVNYTLYSK